MYVCVYLGRLLIPKVTILLHNNLELTMCVLCGHSINSSCLTPQSAPIDDT